MGLFNVDEKTLDSWDIPPRDKQTILKAHHHLETLYGRYRKQKLGWKKGASSYLNQKYIMDQMEECVMIYTMENLNIAGDWANSEFLNPLSQSNND